MTTYAAVYYYEAHPNKEEDYTVHVFFPDLQAVGLPAITTGDNRDDAKEAAEDFLAISMDMAADEEILLPVPTPIEKIELADFIESEDIKPFRIELDYVTV
ncbi:hypothetical protein MHI18_08645 [Peribacillus sp. FSL H8-0477]|uniref:type II toxin-antitoxin system HicB family antitoxin n=1 Tax=Peribacillus sp. FSL H8-0477 TaxID=2921388 RepID=UPI0030FCC983